MASAHGAYIWDERSKEGIKRIRHRGSAARFSSDAVVGTAGGNPKVSGPFANLKAGQAITVREVSADGIDGDSKLPQPHTILEVDDDFVVVKDFTGLNETRIPITSVKAVVHFKGFERK